MRAGPVAVLGAGAVGLLLAAFLANRATGPVHLLGRGRVLEPIRANGLAADGLWGDARHPAGSFGCHTEADSLLRAAEGRCPLVIIASRTNDTAGMAPLAMALAGGTGAVLSVQNGLGNWEALADAGARRIVGGVLNTGVDVAAPGLARVTVQGRPLQLGSAPVPGNDPAIAEWCRAVLVPHAEACGIPVAFAPDVRAEQWKKLAYNCALNAATTLLGGTYRDYAAQPGGIDEMRAVIREVYAVAAAAGVPLDPPTVEGYDAIFFGPGGWLERTLDHVPSMARQLATSGRSEIESLNGAIARLGAAHGVPTPVNARLADGIRALSAARRP